MFLEESRFRWNEIRELRKQMEEKERERREAEND